MKRVLVYVQDGKPDRAFRSVAAMLAHLPGLVFQDYTGLSEEFHAYELLPRVGPAESVKPKGQAVWIDVGTVGNSMYARERRKEAKS